MEKFCATVSFLTLVLFVSVVLISVHEVDLWLVNILVLCMAFAFIRKDLRANGASGNNKTKNGEAGK